VTACVLVTLAGAGAAAAASAAAAATALVGTTQERLTGTLVDQVGAVAPELTFPPDQASLDRLRTAAGPDTVVTYRDLTSADGAAAGLVTDELRRAVRTTDRLMTQRVVDAGRPWLLIGTPVLATAPDGARAPSGIEVYAARDLSPVDRQVGTLARNAVGAAVLALPLAVVLALLAAHGVLRPVRDLRDTARRLAAGDLAARSTPVGRDEVADLTATVNEMAASVQRSMASMRQMQADERRFVADVSHELRTPLSTLTAVTEVLAAATARMEPDAQESARLAITETRRLVRLVEDLMEISRFDAGTAELRTAPVDVSASVRDCLAARGWLPEVDLVTPGPVPAQLDPRRLDVVVANLVGNALRHGAPPVRVTVSAGDDLRVEVTDHGPGLPPAVVPHVFDRFYKADTARGRTPGSGLGLAIARENARLHGGELTAGSAPWGGARFVLRLPTAPGPEDQ
jgi:two-component system sensor histidine kinase MtrB